MDIDLKRCFKCGAMKPLAKFHRHSGMRDGHLNKCASCVVKDVAEWRRHNPDARVKEYARGQGAVRRARGLRRNPSGAGLNMEKRRATGRRWYYAHKDQAREIRRKWEKSERGRASIKAKTKRRASELAAACRDRQIKKVNATPKWRNKFFIREAYDLARRRTIATGFKWHVDHIIPIKNKIVCGLHVENNLQVIPASVNARKSNSFPIGCY